MTSITPEFITREYIQLILLKNFEGQSGISLIDYSIEAGTKKGENFASQILRARVKYSRESAADEEISFVIKGKSDSSEVAELLAEFDVFARECFVYREILAKCSELDPTCKIGAKLIHADDNAMVFEDLSISNFKLRDRKQRLCLSDTKLALRKLAKFHALTAVAASNDKELMRYHTSNAINTEVDNVYHFFFMISMMETLETVKEIPELARFVDWMEVYDMVAKVRNVFSNPDEGKFVVLNHGDMWMNNVMFQHNESEETSDVALVDFQECFYGSPGIDLNTFLYSSCDLHVLENNSDSLIKFYYDTLAATLKQLNFANIPTLADIQREFDMKADQALVSTCTNVPLLLIENTEHAKPEYFLAETEEAAIVRREIWSNPKFIEALKVLLPLIDSRKVFHN